MNKVKLRRMEEIDCKIISKGFQAQGWNKPYKLYKKYFIEQQKGERDIFIAEFENEFAGYVTIQWQSPEDANGNKVPIELVSYPDNFANFVQTGVTTTNGASVSSNTEVMNYRLGFTNMSNRGIIPNSDLFRNSLSFAGSVKAHEKLTISTNFNVNRSWSNNRPPVTGDQIHWSGQLKCL